MRFTASAHEKNAGETYEKHIFLSGSILSCEGTALVTTKQIYQVPLHEVPVGLTSIEFCNRDPGSSEVLATQSDSASRLLIPAFKLPASLTRGSDCAHSPLKRVFQKIGTDNALKCARESYWRGRCCFLGGPSTRSVRLFFSESSWVTRSELFLGHPRHLQEYIYILVIRAILI